MPEINGTDLAVQLNEISLQLRIYTSGYTADVVACHGVLEEPPDFIQKPFSLEELAAKVRKES